MAFTTIQLRRGTSGEWLNENPVLAQGEPGIEIDTGILKVGDGVNTWTSLPATGGGGEVDSVNGLTGDVIIDAESVGAVPISGMGGFTRHIILGATEPVPTDPEPDSGTIIFRTAT